MVAKKKAKKKVKKKVAKKKKVRSTRGVSSGYWFVGWDDAAYSIVVKPITLDGIKKIYETPEVEMRPRFVKSVSADGINLENGDAVIIEGQVLQPKVSVTFEGLKA